MKKKQEERLEALESVVGERSSVDGRQLRAAVADMDAGVERRFTELQEQVRRETADRCLQLEQVRTPSRILRLSAYNLAATRAKTRHRASTSMYSLTFCVRFLLPERHQWKPAVQTAAVMLRTPPRRPVAGRPAAPASRMRHAVLGAPPSPAGRRLAARADPAQPAVRTMSSYRGMDASL